MNLIQKLGNAFSSGFASYTEVTNSQGIEQNPLLKTLENMNTRPRYKTVDGLEYLTFGASDDVDIMIDKLMYKSATHSGIVTKKAKMITGSGLSVNSQLIGTKDAKLNTLIKHAGGANVGLYNLITKSAFEYTKSGQNLDITWENNKLTDKVMMTSSASPFSTDGSDFKEWLIDGGKITSSNNTYVGTNSGFSVWNTAAVDLNITFKNFTFDLTDMTEGYLFNFLHNGTVLFENCIFKANSAITADMTRTILGSPSIDCGTMTFKDCKWVNVTPTYRIGDMVITTPTNEVVQ